MRKKIVAGNWKMNKTLQEGIELAKAINTQVQDTDVTVILCTPFIHLTEARKVITKKSLFLGAQNCASEKSGAYTGEVSVDMIASVGAEYVIIGHSERRSYYHEDDALLNKKVKLALEAGLVPIFCCGEVLAERQSGIHMKVVSTQVEKALFDLTPEQFSKVVIAYEPVWAIGTGVNATAAQAQEMHKAIRDQIMKKFGKQAADNTSILYGGSCKPSNARELFSNADVDGGLIGGASLNAVDFMGIITAF
ncbi:MAG TPA: triose-phosphate isomerase [Bacteroidales bacterium]|jgi:triosephosphate isomerase|nr:triose-phosphate isomerase [Bacteroidales bacterium]